MPMGLLLKEPSVDQRWVYSAEALWAMRACSAPQPPASIRPRIGMSREPAQMSTNCSTSLKMAERRPPSATYTATVSDEIQMLKLMFQPSTTFVTRAMEYMLMPLISTVMKAKEMAARARLDSPYRSFK